MNASEGMATRIAGVLGQAGIAISVVWGFAEATLWFIVPDVAVGAVALLLPSRWWRVATATIAASLLGGLVLFTAALVDGDASRTAILALPGIDHEMASDVRDELAADGGSALVRAPLSGVPYKVYTVEMADQSWGVASYLAWSLPSRTLRILPVAAIAALVGWWLAGFIRRRTGAVLAAYVAGWVVLYVFYFRSVGI